jgi:hypothetical protein
LSPPAAPAPAELRPRKLARLPDGHAPVLLVTADAEEEFDWSAPLDRRHTGVSNLRALGRAQALCDRFGIRPTYVVDYPVATQPAGAGPLRDIARDGRCTLGAHLHPWVCPPFDEEVGPRNSFPGNLPRELEAAKLRETVRALEAAFGARPPCYQAGRFGIGPNTAGLLEELGFEVDFSVCPPFDYSAEGGPDFSRFGCETYWFGQRRRLLGIPLTGAYVGWVRGGAHAVYRAACTPAGRRLRAPGALAALRAVDRLRLSPEGFEPRHHRRLTEHLLAQGVRVFTWSYHTPSLAPGHTPYVRSEAELAAFLDRFTAYFEWFLGDLGGVAMTPLELRDALVPPEG